MQAQYLGYYRFEGERPLLEDEFEDHLDDGFHQAATSVR
jgi:hypothetical protein